MKRKHRHQIGQAWAILAIVILLGQEALGFLLSHLMNFEMSPGDYSRLMFSVPVSVFFFLGHKWALWLLRIGFSLAILSSIFLLAIFVDGGADGVMLAFSVLTLICNMFATWIVFGSESFKSYFRHRRRSRGLYE